MKHLAIQCIKLYQQWAKFFWQTRPLPIFYSQCRYYPSCSEYGIQALEKYGFMKGIIRAAWRIIKCNPFSRGGVDYI